MTSTETLDLLDELLALFVMPFSDHCLNICDLAFFSLYVTYPALGKCSVSLIECDSITLISGVWDHFLGAAVPCNWCDCPETQLPSNALCQCWPLCPRLVQRSLLLRLRLST